MRSDTHEGGVTAIVPVSERTGDLTAILTGYHALLKSLGRPFEIICILDGKYAHLQPEVQSMAGDLDSMHVLAFARNFGESAALALALKHSSYDLILTLPAYEQVDREKIKILFDFVDNADLIVARRWPRTDSGVNRFSNRLFHTLLNRITGVKLRDIGCGVRLIHRRVFSEISVYGDQHRFLPVLADRRGFSVLEVDIPQASADSGLRVYSPRVYISRLLDLIGVFFLARFTKKPLRFFGMTGSIMGGIGVIALVIAVAQRLFFDTALADRPILLFGSLFVVLGAQLFALGLIGELIIFTTARNLQEYAVAETMNFDQPNQRTEQPVG